MDKELKTAAKWAKDLGVSEKEMKAALKGIEPDAKKGVCAYFKKETAEKALAVAR